MSAPTALQLLEFDICRDGAAATALATVSSFEPDIANAPASLVLMGAVHYARAEYEESVGCFADAIRAAGGPAARRPFLYTNRSAAYFAQGQPADLRAAIADADAAIGIDAACARAHLLRGISLRALDRFAEAEAALRRGLAALDGAEEAGRSPFAAVPTQKLSGRHRDPELHADLQAALEELEKIRAYLGETAPAADAAALGSAASDAHFAAAGGSGGRADGSAPGGASAADAASDPAPDPASAASPPRVAMATDGSSTAVHAGVTIGKVGGGPRRVVSADDSTGSAADGAPAAAASDEFTALEDWLLTQGAGGCAFPQLHMKSYGSNGRGVHCRTNIEPERDIMTIGREFLITVEMGKACPAGRKLVAAGLDASLSAAKHCYLALFVLWDRRNAASFFQPYYRILPAEFPNMPIFWDEETLALLEGSYFLQQVADRKTHLTDDYNAICAAVPEVAALCSLQDFWWARMMVASRNFGISVDGLRTDALVPYADMLNHYRPRQTRWFFDSRRQAFVIQSLVKLHAGQQVYDSYGKKCNSRFLLNYGFTVEHNRDDDVGQDHNEVRLWLTVPENDALRVVKERLGAMSRSVRVSTYADNDNTVEAFAFLRYAHASMEELTLMPRIGPDYDFVRRPIQPLSVANELSALRHLAALAREQLAAYPTSLEQDAAELASGRWAYGSNRRNALVLLHGEKAVCSYYVRLSDTARRVAAAPAESLEALIAAEFASVSDEDKYVRATLLPLLRRHRRSLQASAAANSHVAVSGAAAAVVPSSAPSSAFPAPVADGSSPEQYAAAATAASAGRPPASTAAPACGGSGFAAEAASPATSESSSDRPLVSGVPPDASSPGAISPSSTVEVVGWRPDLLPAFEALNREWIEKHFAVEETDLAVFRDPHAKVVAPGGQIFFLLENGAVRGTCAVLRESASRYELGKMAVSPSAQGRGHGDRLLRAAIAFAREAGGEELVLSSNTKLGPALRLYEKHGFTALPHITDTRYSRVNIEMRLPLR